MNTTTEKDVYKTVRRFLYGKDAIKKQENREAIVLAYYKGRETTSYSTATLESCIAYLKVQYKLDPYYEKDREMFYSN